MKKKFSKKAISITGILLILTVIIGASITGRSASSRIAEVSKPSAEKFTAPGKDWSSAKKVEDYFVSNLHMSPEEAQSIRTKPGVDGKVTLRLTTNTTIDALVSNLEYYGFVKDKNALKYALEHNTDSLPGRTDALKIGNNTVDLYASYRISEHMTAWEIADELLNRPTYFAYDEYRYLFMP